MFCDGGALWYNCFGSVVVVISDLTLVLMTWEHSSNAHHLVAATWDNALASAFCTKGWGGREACRGSQDGSRKFPEDNNFCSHQ